MKVCNNPFIVISNGKKKIVSCGLCINCISNIKGGKRGKLSQVSPSQFKKRYYKKYK